VNFTAKEDYGIRAVVDIAINRGDTPVQAKEIAARQEIPEQFLEQLLSALRRAGIIRSIRGAGGGYDLEGAPERITVGDIMRALSGPIVPNPRAGDSDAAKRLGGGACDLKELWERIRLAVCEVVDTVTVQDLVDRHRARFGSQAFMMNI